MYKVPCSVLILRVKNPPKKTSVVPYIMVIVLLKLLLWIYSRKHFSITHWSSQHLWFSATESHEEFDHKKTSRCVSAVTVGQLKQQTVTAFIMQTHRLSWLKLQSLSIESTAAFTVTHVAFECICWVLDECHDFMKVLRDERHAQDKQGVESDSLYF